MAKSYGPSQWTYGLSVGPTHPDIITKDQSGNFGIPRTIKIGMVYDVPAATMPMGAQIRNPVYPKYAPPPKSVSQWSGMPSR